MRGGIRKPGPGKKIGRPVVKNKKTQFHTRLPTKMVEWLKEQKNQAVTVEKAIELYRNSL